MTKMFLALALLSFPAVSCIGQTAGCPDFELVETIPVETILDNPEIRNSTGVWVEMINRAKQSIDFEEFYVVHEPGEPLDSVIGAIISAAGRGVQVRFIADARMYRTYPRMIDSLGAVPNIAKRIVDFRKLAGGVQHAKYFIVDGEEIFLGSQNFDWRALKHIHELGLRIRHHDAVRVYRDIFELDWKLAEHNDSAKTASLLAPVTYTVPFVLRCGAKDSVVFTPTMSPKGLIIDSTLWDETSIVKLIDGAEKDVMCQFLTYSPAYRDKSYYSVLNDALIRAAARGVKVKLIVADWSKESPTVDYLKKLSRIPNIEVNFSVIPEYSGGYISFARVEHCKYIVADEDEFWLGTSNAERGYFYSSRNVGVVAKNKSLAGLLRKIFLKDWEGPYMEKVDGTKEYTPRTHGEKSAGSRAGEP
jgi:phosphatidylserine/phosphatidylglycerophosphate/cardiolipin synthase-like enzyme